MMMEIIEHVPGPGLADEEGISRRDLLTTTARLGTGLAIGAAALGTGTLGLTFAENALAAGTMLQLYNDKANWAPWINMAGQSALKAAGVGWKSVPYADTTTYQASIRTSARTSKAPDLFTWWSGWLMKDIVDAGLAQDVSALWDRNGGAFSKDLRAIFTFNGKTYGLPFNVAYWVVLYNKHVFARYGLQPPTTWAQFMSMNKTLKSHGVTPLGATTYGRWPGFIYFEELLVRSDPALYNNLMVGKAKYTDPGVVKVMNLWGQMIKAGYFTDPAAVQFGTAGTNDLIHYFSRGKVAMMDIGSWYEPTLTAAGLKPGRDYGAFIMPNVNPKAGNVVIFESGPLVVGAHGAHKEVALKAATYFMSQAGQQRWINITGFIPPRSDVKVESPVDRQLVATINQGHYKLLNRFWEATPHDIVEVAVDQFDKFMLHPNDEMSVLKTIQSQADQTWASLK
jgi:ABC-type glycerol-3-phosphate transport system substrate-binding protein